MATGSTLEIGPPPPTLAVILHGTVNEVTGQFSASATYFVFGIIQCDLTVSGTAAADATTFTGHTHEACPSEGYLVDTDTFGSRCDNPGQTCCGNGVIETGELCDGPCCLDCATGAHYPAGAFCTNDDNPCTDDVCDDQAVCTHVPNTALCNAGELCEPSGRCAAGACVPMTCRTASAESLRLSEDAFRHYALRWRWSDKSGTTDLDEFGSLDFTSSPVLDFCYEVPLAEGSTTTVTSTVNGGSAHWMRRGSAYRYSDPSAAVTKAMVRATDNRAQLSLSTTLTGQLPVSGPVHARLRSRIRPAVCFDTTFVAPRIDTAQRYSASR